MLNISTCSVTVIAVNEAKVAFKAIEKSSWKVTPRWVAIQLPPILVKNYTYLLHWIWRFVFLYSTYTNRIYSNRGPCFPPYCESIKPHNALNYQIVGIRYMGSFFSPSLQFCSPLPILCFTSQSTLFFVFCFKEVQLCRDVFLCRNSTKCLA